MLKLASLPTILAGAIRHRQFSGRKRMPTVQIIDVPNRDATGRARRGAGYQPENPLMPGAQEAINTAGGAGGNVCAKQQVYFKYCSTFDSTAEGNIGPVTDALMVARIPYITVISPALPVNGRTVYQGPSVCHEPLAGGVRMRHHPGQLMTDSYLPYLMEAQACALRRYSGLVSLRCCRRASAALQQEGCRYAVLDASMSGTLKFRARVSFAMPCW